MEKYPVASTISKGKKRSREKKNLRKIKRYLLRLKKYLLHQTFSVLTKIPVILASHFSENLRMASRITWPIHIHFQNPDERSILVMKHLVSVDCFFKRLQMHCSNPKHQTKKTNCLYNIFQHNIYLHNIIKKILTTQPIIA